MIEELKSELFSLPYKDGYILYVPKKGVVMGVDARVNSLVKALLNKCELEDSEFTEKWISIFHDLGLFNEPGEINRDMGEFLPVNVTLSLTTRCSLACTYCYARAGESHNDMQKKVGERAIYVVSDNAVKLGKKSFSVAFHGEGEPTSNWNLLEYYVRFAEDIALRKGLEVSFTMSTNGMWNKHQYNFIVNHFTNISISMDGVQAIQDLQRPTVSGKGSFNRVMNNLKALDESDLPHGIRSTVLPEGLNAMTELVDLISSETRKCDVICFEPCAPNGRGLSMQGRITRKEFYDRFLEEYRKAWHRGLERNISVTYSGCKPTTVTGTFCKAYGADLNFVVMSDGTVSSCYEIKDPETEKGRLVVYGRYNDETDSFEFDQERLKRLRALNVTNFSSCEKCFIKWNCGGDCIARGELSVDYHYSPRCNINQQMTLDELVFRAIENSAERKTVAFCP